jgi:predicted NBD/HSP70 family sugar kinase
MTRADVARPDAIRRHNLGLLLEQIHRDGELTRAQLTRRLSMSRSTVGALVADLCDLGLLAERVPSGGVGAGRPSHVVGPRPDGPFVVAVDVDVTHVTVAAVGIGGFVLSRHRLETPASPPDPEDVAAKISGAITTFTEELPGGRPVAIGISVPGTVRRAAGVVQFAPNLEWREVALRDMVTSQVPAGVHVSIGNDADLAVLAEHLRGSARDSDDVVYLMARVGVGAGIISGGRPLSGHDGLAGEVGHNVVDVSGPPCHCGKRGCVETYIGETALLAGAGRTATPTPEAVGAVFEDARSGDTRAASAIEAVATALGQTVASLANVLNPERVLLGGSLANVLDFAGPQVLAALDAHVLGGWHGRMTLMGGDLGEDSALLGAAELAFARLLADPVTAAASATG